MRWGKGRGRCTVVRAGQFAKKWRRTYWLVAWRKPRLCFIEKEKVIGAGCQKRKKQKKQLEDIAVVKAD